MTRYRIMSDRLWKPRGTVVSEDMLPVGCNIDLLIGTGHLARVEQQKPVKTYNIKPPVEPEPEPAAELEEQP